MNTTILITDVRQVDEKRRRPAIVNDELYATITSATKNFKETNDFCIEMSCLAVFVLLQIIISTGSYSGQSRPPMFGDFEAQRHWMEITTNLPLETWYVNSTQNDLNYWGLDYPPLTAYHSWLLGQISERIDPSWTALFSSRGVETPAHKLFMRLTVIASMTLLYAPAVLALTRRDRLDSRQYGLRLLATLCYPGLMFVDNGHFQYNHIALCLFLWAIYFIGRRRYYVGSVAFVLALNFKQMELYHALPIFVYLLAHSFRVAAGKTQIERFVVGVGRVAILGAVVLATFVVLWAPLVSSDWRRLAPAIFRRLFPLSRGVFEDKVANFWFASSIVFKMRGRFSNETLAFCSAAFVLATILPSLALLYRHATERNLRTCLVISSMAFYLFSFQVHEKTILQAAVPALLVLEDGQRNTRWLLSASLFSLFPLCLKDGQPEIASLFFVYNFAIRFINNDKVNSQINRCLEWTVWSAMLIVVGLELFSEPPPRYPHLYTVANALLSFAVFSTQFAVANYNLFCNILHSNKLD